MLNPTEPRLTPVPETDEAYDSIMHVLHHVARKHDSNAAFRPQQRLVRTDHPVHAHRLVLQQQDGQRHTEEKMTVSSTGSAAPNRGKSILSLLVW